MGPLRLPSDGNTEVEQNIETEVANVLSVINEMRAESRRKMLQDQGGQGTYVSGPIGAAKAEVQATSSTANPPGGVALQR